MNPEQIASHALAQYARAYASAGSYQQARNAHSYSSDAVLYIEKAWAAMMAEDAAVAASGAGSFEAMCRGADVVAFEAGQRAQGLEKVYGTDGVAQWLPKLQAAQMAVAAYFQPRFANLDPHSVGEANELIAAYQAAMAALG